MIVEPSVTTKESCLPKAAYQPLGMACASAMNLIGAIAALVTVPDTRTNPFFYTAMMTSAMYLTSNVHRLHHELTKEEQEKQEPRTKVEILIEEREKNKGNQNERGQII